MAAETYVTPRGFEGFLRLTDLYGATVRVQQSSLATTQAVWIFTEGDATRSNDGSAHLDREMARQVRDALDAFLAQTEGE